MTLSFEVVEAVSVNGLVIAACDLITGEVQMGKTLTLSEGGGEWELLNVSSVSPELHEKGRRGITLRPIDGSRLLSSGDVVKEKQSPAR